MDVITIALGVIVIAVLGSFAFKRMQADRRVEELRATWASANDRDRNMAAIATYFNGVHATSGTNMDDRTWSDLDMDAIFADLDRTQSAVGQQLLYARLRMRGGRDDTAAFETLVEWLATHQPRREKAQLSLSQLRDSAAYDLWWLAQPESLSSEWWHRLFPVIAIVMAASMVAAIFKPQALIVLVLGTIGGIVARGAIANSLRAVTSAFRQVSPLLSIARTLVKLEIDVPTPWLRTLSEDVRRLSGLSRYASWAGRESSGAAMGELTGIVIEYLNLLFWLDANALFLATRELRTRGPELLRVIAAVGEVDAAIAVASYRAGTSGWTRPTFRADYPAVMTELVHPLLPEPVPNSMTFGPPHGVLITGSNMSGKSTFLRTVGVSVVMAQAINTCLASHYEAPWLMVRTCIGRGDDLQQGKSYYMAEVDAVLSMVTSAGSGVRHLLVFDELFRGTNAVERIAIGEAVLRYLVKPGADGDVPHVVLAATHDQELVDLLAPSYAPGHFTDTIDDKGLSFDYVLKPGGATTRNAIALLAHYGAPSELVQEAQARADAIDGTRRQAATDPREPIDAAAAARVLS